MKHSRVLFAVLFLLLLSIAGAAAGNEPSQEEMRTEVAMLVKAAEELTILWPWSGPVPEVARVATYGNPIAQLLVDLLADDPESVEEPSQKINLHVQQQVALALCKIYGVTDEAGHVYMNRASREVNARVKLFWIYEVYGRGS